LITVAKYVDAGWVCVSGHKWFSIFEGAIVEILKRAAKFLVIPLAFVGAFVVIQFILSYVGVAATEAKAGALIASVAVASALAHSLSHTKGLPVREK
jgi:hypothetical protein